MQGATVAQGPMAEDAMVIEAPALGGLAGVRHAFFTRRGGVSEGLFASLNGGLGSSDDPGRVAENRRRMAGAVGLAPGHLLSLYQIHSAEVVTVEAPWSAEERPRADAMVTKMPGLALGIGTADCGPVLFADPAAGVIGAAHAGWKGALGGVLEATLDAMEALGARRAHTIAVLGPTISQAAYEVGPEFVAGFVAADPGNRRFFAKVRGSAGEHFDLPGYIGQRLRGAGVGVFADLALCTYADPGRFFSYRRTTHRGEPDYGRLIAAIALSGPAPTA